MKLKNRGALLPLRSRCRQIRGWSGTTIRPSNQLSIKDNSRDDAMSLLRHELRTPLTGIMGMCSLLQMADLASEQQKWVMALSDSARQMKLLIKRLANCQTLHAFPAHGTSGPVNALLLLESVIRSHWPCARKKNIELLLLFDEDLPEQWSCDGSRLRQLIDNLLTNAIKFTHKGYVLLEVSKLNDRSGSHSGIECIVSDTGIGIRGQDSDRIYQVREQLSSNPYHDPSSSGLGLYVCRNIAQSLGGSIQHKSNDACGTTFKVTLPQVELEYSKVLSLALLNDMSCLVGLAEPLSSSLVAAIKRIGLSVETVSQRDFPKKRHNHDLVICEIEWLEECGRMKSKSPVDQGPVLISFQNRREQKNGNGIISIQAISTPILYSDLRVLFLKTALELMLAK